VLDLGGFPALDVIIGLAFVYFLLSIVVSALTEALSGVSQLRFRTMRRGLRELMVTGDVDKRKLETLRRALDVLPGSYEKALAIAEEGGVLGVAEKAKLDEYHERDHSKGDELSKKALRRVLEGHEYSVWDRFERNPRFQALWKQTGFWTRVPLLGKRGPSYLPPRVFALTLLDTLAPQDEDERDRDVVKQAERAAQTVENPLLRKWLQDALAEGGEKRDQILASIEGSFDSVMNRVSGWYKRYATIWVVVFSALLVVAMNADSYAIGMRLWKDEAVRSAVVAQAGGDSELCAEAGGTDGGASTKATLAATAACVNDVEALGLPFGWTGENRPEGTFAAVTGKALGLVITVFALMLGAPFWFDTLSKLARLRTTGKPEAPAKAS
jgi:hypothetical protein